jgi:hypothetical protein
MQAKIAPIRVIMKASQYEAQPLYVNEVGNNGKGKATTLPDLDNSQHWRSKSINQSGYQFGRELIPGKELSSLAQ